MERCDYSKDQQERQHHQQGANIGNKGTNAAWSLECFFILHKSQFKTNVSLLGSVFFNHVFKRIC
jgi:hypothetical protein